MFTHTNLFYRLKTAKINSSTPSSNDCWTSLPEVEDPRYQSIEHDGEEQRDDVKDGEIKQVDGQVELSLHPVATLHVSSLAHLEHTVVTAPPQPFTFRGRRWPSPECPPGRTRACSRDRYRSRRPPGFAWPATQCIPSEPSSGGRWRCI